MGTERIDISECTSQKDAIVKHLTRFGNLTQKEATRYYGATRLSAIIFDLRAEGYMIETHMVVGKNRFGHTSEYAKYMLIKEGE